MFTFEVLALLLAVWAYLQEVSNKTDIHYKPDTDGSNYGSPVMWYNYNIKKRYRNKMLGWCSLALAVLGILLLIWTPFP